MIYTIKSLPPECLQVIEMINERRQQLRYSTSDSRRRWTGLLRRSTFARSIQGSNSIEGYNVTKADALAAVDEEEPLDADAETWAAIMGYRNAMTYVMQLAADPYFTHNEGTIRSLHYMMISHDLKHHPGLWRPGAVWVTREPSGETVYEGPEVGTVRPLMLELVASLNADTGLPVMVRAAMAHLNLVMIHPFSDGNGRMGRALQSLVLAREGIVAPEFSSIEEHLGIYTPDYYKVLGEVGQGAWHPENDAMPWIKFCLEAHYRQAEVLLRRTKEWARVWSLLELELKQRGLFDRMMFAVFEAAFGARVRNSGYRKQVEVSDEIASRDLRSLVEQGLLIPEGERRGRHYRASPYLLNIRNSAREPRKIANPFDELVPAQDSLPGIPAANGPYVA